MSTNNKYTQKVTIPQYVPSGKDVKLSELIDIKKCNQIIKKIKESNVSDNEKKFLQFAATRHIVFNYSKIADYYANASKEMQELMEDSALVIIDFDDAIAKGYAKLDKNMRALMEGSEENNA